MCKDNNKNLIGQPIFKQILNLIPKSVSVNTKKTERVDTWMDTSPIVFYRYSELRAKKGGGIVPSADIRIIVKAIRFILDSVRDANIRILRLRVRFFIK